MSDSDRLQEHVPTSPLRILIVGAGIGGLAAAIALRGDSREITILESSSMALESGAAIGLNPNAVKILRDVWGIDMHRMAQSVNCQEIHEIGIDGITLHRARLPFEKIFGAPFLLQRRHDIHKTLLDRMLRQGAPGPLPKLITSAKVTECDCSTGVVKTADGRSFTADLIVGADGIHSRVRDAILGKRQVASASGLSAYRAYMPSKDVQDIPEVYRSLDRDNAALTIVVGGDRRVVLYPCCNGDMLNIVAICPDALLREQTQQVWNQEGSTEELIRVFEGFPSWIKEMLARCSHPCIWQLRDQAPLARWYKGRAIIVGDAAHAMLPHQGQGAGQAIEDAEALGAFLAGRNTTMSCDEVDTMLAAVFDARFERASNIQAYSRQQAMPTTSSGTGIVLDSMQFAKYNLDYAGAKDWVARRLAKVPGQS